MNSSREAEDRRSTTGASARRDAYISDRTVLAVETPSEDGSGHPAVASLRGADTPVGSLARGVLAAASDIVLEAGTSPRSASIDSSLFVVRCLLTLREQLSPFHVQVSSNDLVCAPCDNILTHSYFAMRPQSFIAHIYDSHC